MKYALIAACAVLTIPAASLASDRIAEDCRGTEVVRIGTQSPRTLPYHLLFKADFSAGTVCFDACGAGQSYPIKDGIAAPVVFADVTMPQQTRFTNFDRRTALLRDHQVITLLARVVRDARATCRAVSFTAPLKPGVH